MQQALPAPRAASLRGRPGQPKLGGRYGLLLLDGLIESLPTARVLLLVAYRPEYEHAWGNKTYYAEVRIDPLPPESAEELLTARLGQDETLDPERCAEMLEGMLPMDEVLRQSGQYGPRVAVAEDADAQTKLLAFIGRTP